MATGRQATPGNRVKESASEAAEVVQAQGRSFQQFLKKFYNDWVLHLSQALTFSLITSMLPILMLMLVVVGNVVGDLNKTAQAKMIDQVQKILPPPLSTASHDIVVSAFQKVPESAGLLTVIAVIGALFFGSRLFTLLEQCLDIIYRVPQRSFRRKNLIAFAMLILFIILTPLLILASLIPDQLLGIVQETTNTGSTMGAKIAGIVGSFIVSFILFEAIYTFVPNRQGRIQSRLRSSIRGALTAAIVLQIVLYLFPLYAQNFATGLVGQVTFLLVFLIFFYIIALVILVGAEVNAFYGEGIRPNERDLVTRSSHNA